MRTHATDLLRGLLLMVLRLIVLLPGIGAAAELDIGGMSCARYQNEITNPVTPNSNFDPIDTTMWLFGFSVAQSGAHVMYGDALPAFGFALDTQCKENPSIALLEALAAVKSKHDNPMDLMTLTCATFEARHLKLKSTDAESATTVMTWLLGFANEKSGGHVYDTNAVPAFESALHADCTGRPDVSMFDVLTRTKPKLAPPKVRNAP